MSKLTAGKRIIIEVPTNGTLEYPGIGDLRGKRVTITLGDDAAVDSIRTQLTGEDSDYEEVVVSASSAVIADAPELPEPPVDPGT